MIVKSITRNTSTDYGGSYRRFYYFSFGTTEEEAFSLLNYPNGTRCTHSYDCCGCYYASPAYVLGRSATGRFTLYQDWCQNV